MLDIGTAQGDVRSTGQKAAPEGGSEWQKGREADPSERARRLRAELAEIDRHLSRAMEDLIELMEANNILTKNRLPQPLLERMALKERLREKLRAELDAVGLQVSAAQKRHGTEKLPEHEGSRS